MLIPRKPDNCGDCVDASRRPDVLEAAVLEREMLRQVGQAFDQELMAVQMASMDELTLLTNLHGFLGLTQLWLDACQEMNRPASLLYFDLDSFKRINQRYGRGEGDDALKTFADVLRIAFRESDVVARVGGDEFAVLLTGSNAVAVAGIRSRLNEMLDERNATVKRRYDIRFSIDQIEFDPSRHKTAHALMKAVDRVRHEGAVQF